MKRHYYDRKKKLNNKFKSKKPTKKFSSGNIEASIWENRVFFENRWSTSVNIKINRKKINKNGTEYVDSFTSMDLPALEEVIKELKTYLL